MITRQEKVYIRDLLGVPMAGVPRGGHTSGYRYFSLVGNLEFYVNNLSVEEESVIAGRPMALVSFNNQPRIGQNLTITVNGYPVTYQTQESDLLSPFPQQSVLLNMVNAINSANQGPWAGTGDSPSTLAGAAPLTAPEYGQIAISWNKPFFIEVSQDSTPGIAISLAQQGDVMPEPSMIVRPPAIGYQPETQTVHGYINVCLALRNDILNARRNLPLSSAGAKGDQGGVTFSPRQLQSQTALLQYWVNKLGSALYSTGNPMQQPSGRITV